jgi:hypothetical protein
MSGAVEGVDYAEAARVMFEACPDRFMRAEQCYVAIDALAAVGFITTPPARSYADGVEDAAQIVEHGYRCRTCDTVFIDTPSDIRGGHPDNGCAFPNWDRLTEESQAAAIRLLSQGGKA